MSVSPASILKGHPLQLDFCEPGSFSYQTHNYATRKSTPFAILLTASEGHYELRSAEESALIGPGQFALIRPHVSTEFIHHDGPNGIMTAHWLHFYFNLYGLIDYLSLFDFPLKLPDSIAKNLTKLVTPACDLRGSTEPEDVVQLHAYTVGALSLITKVATRNEQAWRLVDQSRLRPVLPYIQQNLANELSVEILSKQVGLSPSRFHALFSEDFGCSPMLYVKRQRLEAVARLLTGSDIKLATAAELTGFADPFHLSHAFKAYFGISPREYRRSSVTWTQ